LPALKVDVRTPVEGSTFVLTEAVDPVRVECAVVGIAYTVSPAGRCATLLPSSQLPPDTEIVPTVLPVFVMFSLVLEVEKVESEFMAIVPNPRVLAVIPQVSEIFSVAETAPYDRGIMTIGIRNDEATAITINSLLILLSIDYAIYAQ
jgi:hypothetical protein